MDISYSGNEDVCRSPKKTFDESKDFISDLPDQILVHILSFLPIKDAINTILLRAFGDLWRNVQVLDFNGCLNHDHEDPDDLPDYLDENFVDLIRYVLNHHDTSTVDKLCLNYGFAFTSRDQSLGDIFYDNKEWEEATAVQIEKLIRYALSRKVKVLDLNLQGCRLADPKEFYDLPNVLSSNYLTYLKLTAFDIRSCKTIDLKSLSVLMLNKVSLSNGIVEEILLGCPSLENLSLIDCYGLQKFNCKNHKLKKVMLTLNAWELWRVIISCPQVLSLEIDGWIERAFVSDVSSVVDASVSFSYLFRCAKRVYVGVNMLLQKFSQCQTFGPCTWTILVLTIWNFTNVHCPSFEWKNLILKLNLSKWHHPGLSLLLRNSRSLETLSIDIYPSFGNIFTIMTKEAEWIEAYDFNGEEFWDSQEATLPCLKIIMISGSMDLPYVIQMVKFLLRSATQLQKLVVSISDHGRLQLTPEQLQELLGRFKSLPRASPEANIYFS